MSLKNDSSIIAVNIHESDSLKEINSTGLISAYKRDFATALINRNFYETLLLSYNTKSISFIEVLVHCVVPTLAILTQLKLCFCVF